MTGRWLTLAALAAAALARPAAAAAQCATDADCKNGRLCLAGSCAAPGEPGGDGWSLAGGIVGALGVPAVIAFSVLAEANAAASENNFGKNVVPSTPWLIAAGAAGLVAVPVAFAGGWSGREASRVSGLRGLRVAGWICYGLFVAAGGAWITLSALGVDTAPGVAGAEVGLFGAAASLLMSIDAFVIRAQARPAATARRSAGAIWVAPLRLGDRAALLAGYGVAF